MQEKLQQSLSFYTFQHLSNICLSEWAFIEMEAREGIGQPTPPDGQLSLEQDHGVHLNPEKDSFVSSRENSKLHSSFPPVLTYPICQDTVVR